MKNLQELKKRLGFASNNIERMSDEEYEQWKADTYNKGIGDLNEMDGYDCPECKNKGYIAEVRDYGSYYNNVLVPCKCKKIRSALYRLRKSGLKDVVKRYTFKEYETPETWQQRMKETALRFVSDTSQDHWLLIAGQSGCVDADTEYFNGKEWKKIAEYDGEKVLQYNPETKEATMTEPKRYISVPSEKLYKISTLRGSIDQVLSEDHNFAYITSKGNMQKKPFREVMQAHEENIQGFYGKIETAFNYSGEGIELTDNEIRIMCAVMADGSFRKGCKFCSINIKKERKKERLRELLSEVSYKEYIKENGYSEFRFYAPRTEKSFNEFWYKCSQEQLRIIAEEVFFWDGRIDKKNRRFFFSTEKESADFVQFALASVGIRATISIDNRKEKPCYAVCASSGKSTVSMVSTAGKTKAKITEVKPKDGKQYCFEVETGYLVLRRNGRIFITGNSGKTHLCTACAVHYIKAGYDVKYMLWLDESTKIKTLVTDNQEYYKAMKELKEAEVLYIDDLFKLGKDESGNAKAPTAADIKIAFEILNYRYNNPDLITIISTERSLQELCDIDEAVGGRIAERTKKGNYCMIIKKDLKRNYRLKDIQEF